MAAKPDFEIAGIELVGNYSYIHFARSFEQRRGAFADELLDV